MTIFAIRYTTPKVVGDGSPVVNRAGQVEPRAESLRGLNIASFIKSAQSIDEVMPLIHDHMRFLERTQRGVKLYSIEAKE